MNDSIRQLIEQLREQEFVLATPEDANFFRFHKNQVAIPKRTQDVAPPIVQTTPLKPAPSPALILKEEPTPEPKITVDLPNLRSPPSKEEPQPEAKTTLDFPSLRNLLSIVAPELAIIDEIPNDAIARKIADRWKTKNQTAPISVLIYQEPPEQRALLEGIATALDIYFGPAKIVHAEGIEKEKQWEAFLSVADLKMVIVCDYTLWQLNHLMQFYKETPAQATRLLGNIPLFLLPDLSLYLKDPLLKRSLWKALCQKFS